MHESRMVIIHVRNLINSMKSDVKGEISPGHCINMFQKHYIETNFFLKWNFSVGDRVA